MILPRERHPTTTKVGPTFEHLTPVEFHELKSRQINDLQRWQALDCLTSLWRFFTAETLSPETADRILNAYLNDHPADAGSPCNLGDRAAIWFARRCGLPTIGRRRGQSRRGIAESREAVRCR
ncbi:MAG: hypothetical protein KDA91_14855 [Planctomycetaceae bacterium]|nr:hypothetical protein [Planctomycetaceae bacterium]